MDALKIGITCPALCRAKGGIERFAVSMANWLAEIGHAPVIFHYPDKPGDAPLFDLHPAVECIALSPRENQGEANVSLLLEQGLDLLLLSNDGYDRLYLYPLLPKLDVPTIYSEHAPWWNLENEAWNHEGRCATIAYVTAAILLLPSALQSLPEELHEKVTIIPNAVPMPPAHPLYGERRKIVLSVARLAESDKQLSHLIKAFARIAGEFPDWKLRICGEGVDRPVYERLVRELGIERQVELPGNIDAIDEEYAAAQVFCLSSRYECCPFSLLEAMSHALPAVGYGTCYGVSEIIRHGKTGLLAPEMTPGSLGEALGALLRDERLRLGMSREAAVESLEYIQENARKKFLELFRRAMTAHAHQKEDPHQIQLAKARFLAQFRVSRQSANRVFAQLRKTLSQKRAKEEGRKNLLAQLRKNVAKRP